MIKKFITTITSFFYNLSNINFRWLKFPFMKDYRIKIFTYIFVYVIFLLVLDLYFLQFFVIDVKHSTIYYTLNSDVEDFIVLLVIIILGFSIIRNNKLFNVENQGNIGERLFSKVPYFGWMAPFAIFRVTMVLIIVFYCISAFFFWFVYFLFLVYGTNGTYWAYFGLTDNYDQSLNRRIINKYWCYARPIKIKFVRTRPFWKWRKKVHRKYLWKIFFKNLRIHISNIAKRVNWNFVTFANVFFGFTKKIIIGYNYMFWDFFHGFCVFNSIIFFVVCVININFFFIIFGAYQELSMIRKVIILENNIVVSVDNTQACDSEMDSSTIVLNHEFFNESKAFDALKPGVNGPRELVSEREEFSNIVDFAYYRFHGGPKFFSIKHINNIFEKNHFISPWQFNFSNYTLPFMHDVANAFYNQAGYPNMFFLQNLLQVHFSQFFFKSHVKNLATDFDANTFIKAKRYNSFRVILESTYMNYGVRLINRLPLRRRFPLSRYPVIVKADAELNNYDFSTLPWYDACFTSIYAQYEIWLRFHELLFANYNLISFFNWHNTKLRFGKFFQPLLNIFLYNYRRIPFFYIYPFARINFYRRVVWFNSGHSSFDYNFSNFFFIQEKISMNLHLLVTH